NRLVSTREIDDAQPPHPQAGVAGNVNAFVVRTAMHDRVAHPPDHAGIDPRAPISIDNSRNSAHYAVIPNALIPSEAAFQAERGISHCYGPARKPNRILPPNFHP